MPRLEEEEAKNKKDNRKKERDEVEEKRERSPLPVVLKNVKGRDYEVDFCEKNAFTLVLLLHSDLKNN